MGKIRKPGPALTRTYIRPGKATDHEAFHARMIDLRSGTDVKCSGATIEAALACARTRATKKGNPR